MLLGFLVFTPVVRLVLFPKVPLLAPYDSFMHHTFAVLVLSALTLVGVSRFTKRKPAAELRGVVWSREALRSPTPDGTRRPAWQSLKVWWGFMFATIAGLCAATAWFGSHSRVLEAERSEAIAEGGVTEIRPRGNLPDFNLWTGTGELLFRPGASASRVSLILPNPDDAEYEVAVVVTRGAGYGDFRVELNGEPARLSRQETIKSNSTFRVVRRESEVYPASGDNRFFVERLNLGSARSSNGKIQLSFISLTGQAVGIDHVIMTRKRGAAAAAATP